MTTTDDLDWLDDESGEKMYRFMSQCVQDGFMPLPSGMKVPPAEGWEARFHGPLAYVRWTGDPGSRTRKET